MGEHSVESDARLTDAERAVIASAIPYGILIAAVELVLATRVTPPAKSDRGASDTLAVIGFCIALAALVFTCAYPSVAALFAACMAVWLVAGVVLGVFIGRAMNVAPKGERPRLGRSL